MPWIRTLIGFQHTAARRRLGADRRADLPQCGFNTQPPEGGCNELLRLKPEAKGFNTQPPEGGCRNQPNGGLLCAGFQHTAARRRLRLYQRFGGQDGRFNTQPPEGGWQASSPWRVVVSRVSTHSRPKAAEEEEADYRADNPVSTHSRPKAAAVPQFGLLCRSLFQHTAARRRLAPNWPK